MSGFSLAAPSDFQHGNGSHSGKLSGAGSGCHGNERIVPTAACHGVKLIFPSLEALLELLLHIRKSFFFGKICSDTQPIILSQGSAVGFLGIRL